LFLSLLLHDMPPNSLLYPVSPDQCTFEAVLRHRGIQPAEGSDLLPDASFYQSVCDSEAGAVIRKMCPGLRRKGVHAIRTLRTLFHNMDSDCDGLNPITAFCGALNALGVWVNDEDIELLRGSIGVESPGQPESFADYILFLQVLVGDRNALLNEQRLLILREAYAKLRETHPDLSVPELIQKFSPTALKPEYCPDIDIHERVEQFLMQWVLPNADGSVQWLDFLDYYVDVSMAMPSDALFDEFVRAAWSITVDEQQAAAAFLHHDSDNSAELDEHEFHLCLREMDQSLTPRECHAMFACVDFDGSGSVSLKEFLESRVMQFKKLFDEADEDGSHSLEEEEFLTVLRKLVPTMAEQEIRCLYSAVDADGGGTVSFVEFVESNLLRVLTMFEKHDTNNTWTLNESQTKAFFKDLMCTLNDELVAVIRGKLDIQSAGELTIVDIVNSNILVSLSMYHKHDKFKRGQLSPGQFHALLEEFDPSLTEKHRQLCFDYCHTHPRCGFISLLQFLQSNILSILKHFNQASSQKSPSRAREKVLDMQELHMMLQRIDPKINQSHVQIVQGIFDRDHSGQVEFAEFIQYYVDFERQFLKVMAATKIQSMLRGKWDRRRTSLVKEELASALTIQRLYRGHRTRKEVVQPKRNSFAWETGGSGLELMSPVQTVSRGVRPTVVAADILGDSGVRLAAGLSPRKSAALQTYLNHRGPTFEKPR